MKRQHEWLPLRATPSTDIPTKGDLVAIAHSVWRITDVTGRTFDDTDERRWVAAGRPDRATWRERPYHLTGIFLGGSLPDWGQQYQGEEGNLQGIFAGVGVQTRWFVYTGGRWPRCSCCGEPMPCRAELQDLQVKDAVDQLNMFAARVAGSCWACAEPITRRQEVVVYDGDNLDYPAGPVIRFHTRAACAEGAREYERRWLAADPTRSRVLTWPDCAGMLVVHHDGSSQCLTGPDGKTHIGEPGCRGHLTHDHKTSSACYGNWVWPQEGNCPRGCAKEGHPGVEHTPRPARPVAGGQLPLLPLTGDQQP